MTDISLISPILASLVQTIWIRLPWILLGSGVAVLWLSLLVLMMSRWGQARPLSKCVALSVLAHLLLLGYAAYLTIPVHPRTVGPAGSAVTVQLLVDDSEPAEQPIERTEWQPAEPVSEKLETVPLPVVEDWTPEPSVERAVVPEPDRSEPLSELAEPLLTSSAEIPPAPEQNPTVEPDTMSPAATLTSETPERTLQPEPEMLPAPPSPERTAPSVDLPSDSADPATMTADTTSPIQGLALLPNHDELPEIIAALEDPANDQTNAGESQGLTRMLEPAARRLSSRPVSVATGRPASADVVPPLYQGRSEQRREIALQQGGSAETEEAVEAALAWLAQAQDPHDGHWDTQAWEGGRDSRNFTTPNGPITRVEANTATTGLALLAFLGAGNTHQQGEYQAQVAAGLEYLRRSQSPSTGSLAGNAGRYVAMYCHGIATLAVSEAYIMTRDEQLRPIVERAVHYTVVTQHPTTGGWRYQPGDQGDTSQFGWQLMALVSARSAGISVPTHVWQGAERWLQRVSLGSYGGLACYTPDRRVPSHSMTAEALACRFFLQGGTHRAAIDEAANFIAREGVSRQPLNLYYCYYGTLALYQVQDHRWVAWNQELTGRLLQSQQKAGSLAGSWDPDTVWGHTGGRVYTTSLACLCLETYYRYLPLLDRSDPVASAPSPLSR